VAPVAPGEPVTEGVLGGAPGTGPDPLAPGERAVSLPLAAAGGAAAAVTPGASVDVVASTGDGPSGRTRIVVAGAEVLAVADAPSPDGVVPDGAGVLVRVSAGQALRITAALNFAREVRLLVRPVDEVGGAVPSAAEAPAP
jgi:Flp pilus assembly protein CpaB